VLIPRVNILVFDENLKLGINLRRNYCNRFYNSENYNRLINDKQELAT
jgi:hypothetical protein